MLLKIMLFPRQLMRRRLVRITILLIIVIAFCGLYTYDNDGEGVVNERSKDDNFIKVDARNESSNDKPSGKPDNKDQIEPSTRPSTNGTLSNDPCQPIKDNYVASNSPGKTIPMTSDPTNWDSGSFCSEYLHRTFQEVVPICSTANGTKQNSITCRRSPMSNAMLECSITNVLIRPRKLYIAKTSDSIPRSGAIKLLTDTTTACESPDMNGVHRTSETGNHVRLMVEESLRLPLSSERDCQRWVDEPSFLFLGMNHHVYFEFLAWYNAYKSIVDHGMMGHSYKVFRVADKGYRYAYATFEKLLFPGIEFLQYMREETVCFKKLILPPQCFASTLFTCKQNPTVCGRCFYCQGNGRSGTTIRLFQARVLKACSLSDSIKTSGYRQPRKIVVILRKQYPRHPEDQPGTFSRIISNSEQLLAGLRANITGANVVSFHGEDLSVCKQIRLVHSADIFIGMHGAGLVHSWWLQDNAMLFEIVPSDQVSNPTFKMLTKLAGINYKEFSIPQRSDSRINVNVNQVIDALQRIIRNGI